MLSIVIPTWNEAARLPRTLAAWKDIGVADEIVVADAHSPDGTGALAQRLGARMVASPRGRGEQLRTGADAARGDWLLFLHADSAPGEGCAGALARFVADPAGRERAGYFRLRLDDPAPAARRIERLAAWRARVFGLPYGDQGLLLARALYERAGGYPAIPIMEDVALVRRLGRRRLLPLDAEIVTSAERYRRDGYWRRPMRNLGCLALYLLGVSPHTLARMYD
jgi:rSAM/selenodomain-associated transferase 2